MRDEIWDENNVLKNTVVPRKKAIQSLQIITGHGLWLTVCVMLLSKKSSFHIPAQIADLYLKQCQSKDINMEHSRVRNEGYDTTTRIQN